MPLKFLHAPRVGAALSGSVVARMLFSFALGALAASPTAGCSAGSPNDGTPGTAVGGSANGGTGAGGSAGGSTGGVGSAGSASPGGSTANASGGAVGADGAGGADPGSGGTPPSGGGSNGAGGSVGAGGAAASSAGGSGGKLVFDAGQDPNRNQVPGDQVCDRVATIECAGEAFCCSVPGRTFDQCKSTMKAGCINQLFLDAITSNPVSGYDETAAAPIFAEYERRASICDPSVTTWAATVDGLRGLPKGTLNSGQSCAPPGYPLAIPSDATAAPYLASCKNPSTTACYPTTLSWTCSPRVNAGSACFVDTNCNDGLYCDNPPSNPSIAGGTCRTRKADGVACTFLDECHSLLCRHSQCVPASIDNAFCLNAT